MAQDIIIPASAAPAQPAAPAAPETGATASPDTATAAPAEGAAEEVKDASGKEGQEQAPAAGEGESAGGEATSTEQSAADPEALPDEIFAELATPADTLKKLREALGDAGAFEVASQLDSVAQLTQEFGHVPTVEEIQELGQSRLALVDLYKNLDENPQEAINFFLLNEKGSLDEMGAKFVGALADGVKRGSVPSEVRLMFGQAIASSMMVDLTKDKQAYEAEAKYAADRGLEAKAKEHELKAFELSLIMQYLAPYAKTQVAPVARPQQQPTQQQPVAAEPDTAPEIQQFMQEQRAYNSQVMGQILKGYIDKLPSSLPASVRENTQYAIERKVVESVRENKNALIRLANGNFQNGYNLWDAGDVKGAEAAFKRAYQLFKQGVTQVAAQVATPVLNELQVNVATKSQSVAAAKQAGQDKTAVLEIGAAGAGAGVAQVQDTLKRLPGETNDQYLVRLGPLLGAARK